MRVLALEPFYGGSHRVFLDGWRGQSRHDFTIHTLPAYKWKWRMRHSALTLARQLQEAGPQAVDVIWASDMLNLAEFRGLAPAAMRKLPCVMYFHENQLTYPVQIPHERDLHFAFSNLTSAIASDQVWFNSEYHRREFLTEMERFLRRMPDHAPLAELAAVQAKSRVLYPGTSLMPPRSPRLPGPPRLLWTARWEHDKNPAAFFDALRSLKASGQEFRLAVLGESFQQSPAVFAKAQREFSSELDHWGFVPDRDDYVRQLSASDIVVSTANHEFFGIGIVEAIAAGAFPLLPDRLSYPEVIRGLGLSQLPCLYDGTITGLVQGIRQLAHELERSDWGQTVARLQRAAEEFAWANRAHQLDDAMEELSHS